MWTAETSESWKSTGSQREIFLAEQIVRCCLKEEEENEEAQPLQEFF